MGQRVVQFAVVPPISHDSAYRDETEPILAPATTFVRLAGLPILVDERLFGDPPPAPIGLS